MSAAVLICHMSQESTWISLFESNYASRARRCFFANYHACLRRAPVSHPLSACLFHMSVSVCARVWMLEAHAFSRRFTLELTCRQVLSFLRSCFSCINWLFILRKCCWEKKEPFQKPARRGEDRIEDRFKAVCVLIVVVWATWSFFSLPFFPAEQ